MLDSTDQTEAPRHNTPDFSHPKSQSRRCVSSGLLRLAALMCTIILSGSHGCREGSSDANSLVGSPSGAREVSFNTDDGWNIFGDAYMPTASSKGAIILLHQRNGAASDWRSLCNVLRTAGYSVIAIDQRGQGRSVQGPRSGGGKGDDAPWETAPDIAAAIRFLSGRGPVALIGASYGANNALIYAAAHPDQVKSLVLFSPGANYHGLDAVSAAKSWRGPIEVFHDRGDTIAGDGPKSIDSSTPSADHELIVLSGSRHGTDLLADAMSRGTESPLSFLQRSLK